MSEGATPADVRETVRKVIGSHGGELALVYGDSSATPAVLSELDKLGRRVPEDVSLATLTDTVHTRVASPPVTGMDLAHEELAERAVALLAARLAGEGVPADAQLVEPVVTERASTRR
jgi:DNA-binding LacI/PurR family transcriptional regulator